MSKKIKTTEKVGRQWERTRYEILYRNTQEPERGWRRALHTHATLEEAQQALAKIGQRYVTLGDAFVVDLGPSTFLFEYAIVKATSQMEVLHVEMKKI